MWVCPRLVVLPMGWDWALHLAQCVSVEALVQVGVAPSSLVLDKREGADSRSSVVAGAYVDNFVIMGP
eukprot:11097602-Karenia_brevis.AAC.1